MIDIGIIKELTEDMDILEFSEFVISETGDGSFPDYKKLDLMKISRLVAWTWVLDLQNGLENGLIFHFSGTKIDTTFGRNITGLDFEKIYPGKYYDELINQTYHQVYLQKRACYTRRIERYVDEFIDTVATIETVLFPCSSDGKNINYALGLTRFTNVTPKTDPIFMLF